MSTATPGWSIDWMQVASSQGNAIPPERQIRIYRLFRHCRFFWSSYWFGLMTCGCLFVETKAGEWWLVFRLRSQNEWGWTQLIDQTLLNAHTELGVSIDQIREACRTVALHPDIAEVMPLTWPQPRLECSSPPSEFVVWALHPGLLPQPEYLLFVARGLLALSNICNWPIAVVGAEPELLLLQVIRNVAKDESVSMAIASDANSFFIKEILEAYGLQVWEVLIRLEHKSRSPIV